ncbi:FecR family protein [Sphingomonas sp.]|uniref:FecR family protein n=1 Tax=Sphingomonas sp. TaxID=28214 RepID=UPI002E0DA914|nr:FecR family protein [Sphingomonas sp.]
MSGKPHPASIDAEAAAWVARLQGERTDSIERGLHAWLEADPAHCAAFERATEIWTLLPGAVRCMDAERRMHARAPGGVPAWRSVTRRSALALAASVLVAFGVGTTWMLVAPEQGYATAVGEQKVAVLEDGSRIALNTNSRVDIDFTPGTRTIRLDHGEAMFEVAHNATRPFIVTAGDKQVRAIGTVFLVRREGDSVTVTLIDGKVAVTELSPRTGTAAQASAILAPGERFTASGARQPVIDTESAEVATAWRHGQAIFRDTPMAEAVAELNRYGGAKLVVTDPRLAALPISGVFATNETRDFAEAMAALHGLHVRKQGETLQIVP